MSANGFRFSLSVSWGACDDLIFLPPVASVPARELLLFDCTTITSTKIVKDSRLILDSLGKRCVVLRWNRRDMVGKTFCVSCSQRYFIPKPQSPKFENSVVGYHPIHTEQPRSQAMPCPADRDADRAARLFWDMYSMTRCT